MHINMTTMYIHNINVKCTSEPYSFSYLYPKHFNQFITIGLTTTYNEGLKVYVTLTHNSHGMLAL